MNLTQEQQVYIKEHLRDVQKTFAVCALAKNLAQKNEDIDFTPEEVETAALIMNIGETSEKMSINGVSIYSKEYGPWDDTAKELNANRGNLSVEMAEEQEIELSDTMKEAIISTSKGGSLNKMGITLKLAQTMEAIKYHRWSRGEKKEPAKNLSEVTDILNDELDFMLKGQDIDEKEKEKIKDSMLSAAKQTYVSEKQESVRRFIRVVVFETEKELSIMGVSYAGSTTLTDERIDEVLNNTQPEQIDDLYNRLQEVYNGKYPTAFRIEDEVCTVIQGWEKEDFGRNQKIKDPEVETIE